MAERRSKLIEESGKAGRPPAGPGRAENKENGAPIEGALDKVSCLEGVRFNWTAGRGGQPDLGFVAEDVAKVLPDLVTWYEEDGGANGLKYGHLTAVAVEAIKELTREVHAKDEKIAELTARLEWMERKMIETTSSKESMR